MELNQLLIQKEKIGLKEKLIRTTEKQTKLLSNDIYINQLKINQLNRDLEKLREDYAQMIVKSYKRRSEQSRAMVLLSSENFLQAYKRAQYMKQYASYRKMQGEEIKGKTKQLEDYNVKIGAQKQEKEKLIAENEKEKQELEKEKKEQEKIANQIEIDLKREPGTREVKTVGGPNRVIRVELDTNRMKEKGVTLTELQGSVASANFGTPLGNLLQNDNALAIETGPFLHDANDVGNIVVAVRSGSPVFLKNIANIVDGADQSKHAVFYGSHDTKDGGNSLSKSTPAVTLSITKKPGANAIDVSRQLEERCADRQRVPCGGYV